MVRFPKRHAAIALVEPIQALQDKLSAGGFEGLQRLAQRRQANIFRLSGAVVLNFMPGSRVLLMKPLISPKIPASPRKPRFPQAGFSLFVRGIRAALDFGISNFGIFWDTM
jgi:hypothetical protein